jgi:hypothetical protein
MAKDLISSFLPTAEVFPNRPLTLQIGATFGPFYINLFSSRPTLIGTYAANPITDTLTLANHGLVNGTMVQVTSATATSNVTDGLETGELYFVANVSTNTLQLSLYPGGLSSSLVPVVDIKNTDAGKLYKCGTPYNLTNHKVWAWVKHLRTDPDTDLILDLAPTITGAEYMTGYDWRISFTKTKTQTFSLTPAVHVWSLLLQFPDATRSLLIDNSRFTIALPTTHPDLIS